MGMTRNLARLLVEEHRRKPLGGRGAILGRQTVFLTPDEARALVTDVMGSVRPEATVETDTYTFRGRKHGYILDTSFFSLFTDADIEVIDYSGYQGATILLDLCAPLPEKFKGQFDFVFNGSVLDNVFDPAAAIDNIGALLTETGSVFHFEGAHHFDFAYLKFHPSWFYDYAVVNDYLDCKVFYCVYKDMLAGNWEVYLWTPYYVADGKVQIANPIKHDFYACIVAVMDKQAASTAGKRPIQANYRSDHQPYINFHNRTMTAGRKYEVRSILAPGYHYLGSY